MAFEQTRTDQEIDALRKLPGLEGAREWELRLIQMFAEFVPIKAKRLLEDSVLASLDPDNDPDNEGRSDV